MRSVSAHFEIPMSVLPHLLTLVTVSFYPPLAWADNNASQLQERFLNISYVPPSPNLLAAVGACQGGRWFYQYVQPPFSEYSERVRIDFHGDLLSGAQASPEVPYRPHLSH